MFVTAAIGISEDDRRAKQVADDHDVLLVPAIDIRPGDRGEEQVRQAGEHEDERHRQRRVRDRGDEERERDLVDAVAEQADELTDPERRERAVQGEPNVRVTPDPAGDLGVRAGAAPAGIATAAAAAPGARQARAASHRARSADRAPTRRRNRERGRSRA